MQAKYNSAELIRGGTEFLIFRRNMQGMNALASEVFSHASEATPQYKLFESYLK